MSACTLCGRPVDGHDRHVRFRLPDPVLRIPEHDERPGTWKTDEDPNAAVMMMVPHVGAFVRALLPVQLNGGHTVTFGVWIGVDPADLKRAYDIWWSDEYAQLEIQGRLANALPAWEVFGVPVNLAVIDAEATPYCVASTDSELQAVLTREWDHECVLAGLPAQRADRGKSGNRGGSAGYRSARAVGRDDEWLPGVCRDTGRTSGR